MNRLRAFRSTATAVALAAGLAALSLPDDACAAAARDRKAKAAQPAAEAPAPKPSAGGRRTKTAKAAVAPPPPAYLLPDATPEQIDAAGRVYYGSYDCEFKQSIDIAESAKHPHYVDVKVAKAEYLMKPVLSSTGAIRLEGVKGDMLMVQIASKSMLMNVKTGQRMVDECVSPRQRELIETARREKAEQEARVARGETAPATNAAPLPLLMSPAQQQSASAAAGMASPVAAPASSASDAAR